MNSRWAEFGLSRPRKGKNAHPSVPTLSVLQKRPYRFKNQNGSPRHYSHISLTLYIEILHFLFLLQNRPWP
jgi:hypothetical protein